MKLGIFRTCAILGVLVALGVDSVNAQSRSALKGLRAGNAIKNYDSNTLTIQELASCLSLERLIEQKEIWLAPAESKLARLGERLEGQKAELVRFESVLNVLQNSPNRSKEFVDNYNFQLAQYEKSVDKYNNGFREFNQLLGQYNLGIGEVNGLIEHYSQICEGKSYYLEDLQKAKELSP